MTDQPYQYMPALSTEERDSLRESIRRNGVLHPIDVDEAGHIIDGHHRAELADEVGVPCPQTVRKGWTEEQKHELVWSNVERRQLTQEQRRELIRHRLVTTPEASNRSIARDVGVADTTVADHRASLEENAVIPHFRQPRGRGNTTGDAVDVEQEYAKAVEEFPIFTPENSPGLPKAKIVRMAEGLRGYPEGPERDVRLDAASRAHRSYNPDGSEKYQEVATSEARRQCDRILEAALAYNRAYQLNGGVAAFTEAQHEFDPAEVSIRRAAFERMQKSAAEVIAVSTTSPMRRVK